jgi:hypothetical protein
VSTSTFAAELFAWDACDPAVEWVGKRSPESAWADCPRGDWMHWALRCRVPVEHRTLVRLALAHADAVAHLCANIPQALAARDATRHWLDGAGGNTAPAHAAADVYDANRAATDANRGGRLAAAAPVRSAAYAEFAAESAALAAVTALVATGAGDTRDPYAAFAGERHALQAAIDELHAANTRANRAFAAAFDDCSPRWLSAADKVALREATEAESADRVRSIIPPCEFARLWAAR